MVMGIEIISMDENKLREFIDEQRKEVCNWLRREKPEGWYPKVLAVVWDYENGELEQMDAHPVGDFQTHEDKQEAMLELGESYHKMHKIPLLVCIVTEAWRSSGSEENPPCSPKDDPDRDEVLVFYGSTFCGGHELMGFIEMDRHPDGYLLPGPMPKLIEKCESALMDAMWAGLARGARKIMEGGN